MAYFIDLFSPETYEVFRNSNQDISGFRLRQEHAAGKVKRGDKLVCYMTKLSRWIGVLEVQSEYFKDDSPLFYPKDDPFVIRFRVKPLAWLTKEKCIPIREDKIWKSLSFTRSYDKETRFWTGKFRSSLNQLEDEDGRFLERLILEQSQAGKIYEIDEEEFEKLTTHKVHRLDKVISVTVPKDSEPENEVGKKPAQTEVRESVKVQAMLAGIGAKMGMKIWIPRNDRNAVSQEWNDDSKPILDSLPLNYDETTIKTIEQIDILWMRGRAIVRAFEVEHTTSIYSGILRMADLLALQPNMNIKLHIVAPIERRDKVFQELRRPVFSLLDEAPLSERCTYISYDSVSELSKQKHLVHLSDSVLDEYAEEAE